MTQAAACVALLATLLACDTESPTESSAVAIYRHSGNGQVGVVGSHLRDSLSVVVADAQGIPVPGRLVSFTVVEGDVKVTVEIDVTDANGLASTHLVLGDTPGAAQISANVLNTEVLVEFTATVKEDDPEQPSPSVPAQIRTHTGNGQEGVVGAYLGESLVVRVVDSLGQPASGAVVTFEVVAGDGHLFEETSTSDHAGLAQARLILGASPGTVTVQAAVAGVDDVAEFSVVARLPGDINPPEVAGLADYALRFDASKRQEVRVGLVSSTSDQYTVECWVKLPESVPQGEYTGEIIGQSASDADFKGTLMVDDGRLKMMITTQVGTAYVLLADTGPPRGKWSHIAGTYDGAFMRLYIEAHEVASVPASGAITGLNLRRSTLLGGYSGTALQVDWFDGDLDEVRIWSAARSADELRSGMHRHLEPQGDLIGYWTFDDGAGVLARDRSGHGHDGELTNYRGEGYPAWVPGVFAEVAPPGDG